MLGVEGTPSLAAAILSGALDDFVHADLSQIDLSSVDLRGMRWSLSGTRWPSDISLEELLVMSKETEPEIYIITDPGGMDRRHAEVPV
jgi:hypothetical protein